LELLSAITLFSALCTANLKMSNVEKESLLAIYIRSIDGIIPTVRVFGILPRLDLGNEAPTPVMLERVRAIAVATQLASQEYERRDLARTISPALPRFSKQF
jgi:hypothetical protein